MPQAASDARLMWRESLPMCERGPKTRIEGRSRQNRRAFEALHAATTQRRVFYSNMGGWDAAERGGPVLSAVRNALCARFGARLWAKVARCVAGGPKAVTSVEKTAGRRGSSPEGLAVLAHIACLGCDRPRT